MILTSTVVEKNQVEISWPILSLGPTSKLQVYKHIGSEGTLGATPRRVPQRPQHELRRRSSAGRIAHLDDTATRTNRRHSHSGKPRRCAKFGGSNA